MKVRLFRVLVTAGAVLAGLMFGAPLPAGATTKAASPASYVITKVYVPSGWTKGSPAGTGMPGLLTTICPSVDQASRYCLTADVKFAAPGGAPFVVEGLGSWPNKADALGVWKRMAQIHGYTRITLGHFGTASRTFEAHSHGISVFVTLIDKAHFVAVLEYATASSGAEASSEATFWNATANSLIPPKSKAPKPTTTTTTTVPPTTTTTTVPPTTTTTATPPTSCAGSCKFTFAGPEINGFVSVALNSITQDVACPDPGACDATSSQQIDDVNVTMCAGSTGVTDAPGAIDDFSLALANSTQASQDSVVFDSSVATAWGTYGAVAPNQCLTGDIYFDAPIGVNWSSLNFAYTSADFSTQQVYVWTA